MTREELEQININTIRILSADMVEKARSGHPGMPMGAAVMAYVLWTRVMKHNPNNPNWINRDRFVLSAGHGSALLYAMLYLTGYDLSIDDLKSFRQWGSKTPGHPEYGLTPGVETTTGPLGQGISTAVGMAIAERFLANRYNRNKHEIIDYHIYGICSDGDLMEGVASEAASIAGHLKLGKLIFFYDDNQISIEGTTELTFTENVKNRFEAYGWQVIEINGNDTEAVASALLIAKKETAKPTLIKAKTHIGYGSPHKQDTSKAHGEPLGDVELKAVKNYFGFPENEYFYIPQEAKDFYGQLASNGEDLEIVWNEMFNKYEDAYPELASEMVDGLKGLLPDGWQTTIPVFNKGGILATRQASGEVLNSIIGKLTLLVGGSADLAPSTGTQLKGFCEFSADQYGCPNFHFGVREHAMGAIINGMALSHLIRPYGSTFLVFSDYMRPAIRLAALMNIPSTFIFTHDSIGMGEDGPTHQPVEHLMALRAIPNLTLYRPADANETAQSWKSILERKKPAAIILTRQGLPVLDLEKYPVNEGVAKGAYILSDSGDNLKLIIIATGSEVYLALQVQDKLEAEGVAVRVVSMPSWELFEQQPEEYKENVLPKAIIRRVSIEAGVTQGWHKYTGAEGLVIGFDKFGVSAPGAEVMEAYGFSAVEIISKIRNRLFI